MEEEEEEEEEAVMEEEFPVSFNSSSTNLFEIEKNIKFKHRLTIITTGCSFSIEAGAWGRRLAAILIEETSWI